QRPAPLPLVRSVAVGLLALVALVGLGVFALTQQEQGPSAGPPGTGSEPGGVRPGSLPPLVVPVALPTPEELAARPAAADALQRPDALAPSLPPAVVAVLGEPRRLVYPHSGNWRNSAKMSKDGKLLAAPSGNDGNVELFDATTGLHLHTLKGPTKDQVREVAISDDGSLLAGVSHYPGSSTALRVWDLGTRQEVFTWTGKPDDFLAGPNVSPDGKQVIAFQLRPEPLLRVWDARTGQEVKTVPGVKGGKGERGEFSPDGKLVAAGNAPAEVVVWKTDTWEVLRRLTRPEERWADIHFSRNGALLAVASEHHFTVWRTDTFEQVGNFEITCYNWFDFLPDGKTILVKSTVDELATHTFTRWDVATGVKKGEFAVENPKPGYLYSSLSPDGKSLIAVNYHDLPYLRIFDLETGEDRFAPTRHEGPVLAVAISPKGETLASSGAGADKRIRLWDLARGRLVRTLPALPHAQVTLAFSPDGKTLASGSENSGAITFWDWQAGQETGALPAQGRTIAQLAFSPDGKHLAFRMAFGETKLYEIATRKMRIIDPGGLDGDGCVAFSPDGKTLATGGSDKVLRLWDVATGAERGPPLSGHEDAIRWAGFRPDGRSVAFCGTLQDRLIRHWELAPRAEKPALRGHTSGVLACAWRGDGKLLVSAGAKDGTVRLWDPDTNPPQFRTIALFPPGRGAIHSIALSPEGRHVVTGNGDGTIYVLRLAKVGEVLRVP
ncbi:MAG: WD40 repeat domain-containing protein, partial [Gemmataceae bacterium]|nr:WD40 repeat domain-containing protein [Gemmataceae bacterium]